MNLHKICPYRPKCDWCGKTIKTIHGSYGVKYYHEECRKKHEERQAEFERKVREEKEKIERWKPSATGKQFGKCLYCNQELACGSELAENQSQRYGNPRLKRLPNAPCQDHIIPRKLGGTWDSWNLVDVCISCNSAKGTKDLITAIRIPEALEAVKEAEKLIERFEEREWSAELHRLRGVFLAAIGADENQIEASFCEAIRIAKEQKSVSLEKRAEVTYAEYRRQKASGSRGRGFRLPL
jgi:5-methylcytosine-specific restriction endonuclease McrA